MQSQKASLPTRRPVVEKSAYLEPFVIHDLSRSRGENLSEARSIFVSTSLLM